MHPIAASVCVGPYIKASHLLLPGPPDIWPTTSLMAVLLEINTEYASAGDSC